jgi:CpeT/CpcT family (DUF1001)
MPPSQTLVMLAQWLAGEFENRTQALDQPAWFVHLHLWHRPVPHLIQGHLALFAEQANVLHLDQPYRQRLLLLKALGEQQFQAQYWAFKQPEQFRGAGMNASLLNTLSRTDLDELPGCQLTITNQQSKFTAQPEPDAKCYFQYDGKTRQVILGFEVSADQFLSYDRGVDPDTGQSLWGALMGAYQFHKCQDFSQELPLQSLSS